MSTQSWVKAREDGTDYVAYWSETAKNTFFISQNVSGVIKYYIGHDGDMDTAWTGRAGLTYLDWNNYLTSYAT